MNKAGKAEAETHRHWYFGWNIVATSSLLTMITVGMRMGIGPFFLPMIDDLGFTRSWLSSVIAIGMLFYGIGMPIAGYLVARRGTRFVILLGTAIVVLSIIWTLLAKNPINFLFAYGMSLSIGLAFTSPVAFTSIVSRWFTRRRGMALFFLSTGSMAGIAVLTPLFTFTISHYGWQNTMIGYAIFFVLLTIPAALFIMRETAPEYTDLLPQQRAEAEAKKEYAAQLKAIDDQAVSLNNKNDRRKDNNSTKKIEVTPTPLKILDAMQTLPFWKVCVGIFSCGFSMNLLGTHGVPMLIDHGFSDAVSGLGIGLIGLVAIFSTIILGRIADVLERRNLLALIYFVRGVGFIALVAVIAPWQLYAVAAICGLVWAGNMALSSAILADLYGIRIVGVLYGWAYLGHQIGAMISSWLGGWAYEQYHTHWIAFGVAAILLFIGSVVSLFIPSTKKIA